MLSPDYDWTGRTAQPAAVAAAPTTSGLLPVSLLAHVNLLQSCSLATMHVIAAAPPTSGLSPVSLLARVIILPSL